MGQRSLGAILLAGLMATACSAGGPLASSSPRASALPSPAAAASPYRCSRVEVSASSPAVQRGQPVSFTATAYGCTPVDYRFIELNTGSGDWMVTQDWGPSATWTWDTSTYPPGAYSIVADARARNELGNGPDASISLPVTVLPGPSPTPATALSCRLPVSGTLPGSGGFIQMPAGTFTGDPASNVPLQGQDDPDGLHRGYTYDPVHRRWLPVPRDWVMADYSSYVYIGTEHPTASNQPSLHLVKLPSGTDSVWPNGDQLYGYPIALRPEGVYGAPGPEIITLVDPTGLRVVVDQGHSGDDAVLAPTAFFARKSVDSTFDDVQRIDLRTGVATDWFVLPGATLRPIGLDGSGNPIIAVGSFLPNGRLVVTQIWIVPRASTGPQPAGELIYDNANNPLTILGSAIASAGALWIETDQGLWVVDVPGNQMRLASGQSGYIAGGCL